MNIPFNDFRRESDLLKKDQLAAIERVLLSGWWILGPEVKAFESAWANFCQTKDAVGVANGLDAIEIGLRALGIGLGDEVITTALTAYATTLAIQRCGAKPVFADISPNTACLDVHAVARCIGPATKAVLVVHLYGREAGLDALEHLCSNHGINLIEDCAQAHGACHQDKPVGSVGKFGAWSFYPTKNLGAIGDAGAITSNDQELLQRARQLRNYGQTDRYHHAVQGMNSRLDELQAAILRVRLPYLHKWTTRRREIAQRYWHEICHTGLEPLGQPVKPESHVHHLFVLRSEQRKAVQSHLQQLGISSLIHYPVPSHQQSALGEHRIDPLGLGNTEKHAETCFSLPIHPYMTDEEVSRVIDACNSAP